MDGRYPFDAHSSGQQEYGQLSAQMRAALGLSGNSIEEALFLQQQQRQQGLQRERLRQLLLQEQYGQQSSYDAMLQGQQLRGLGDHMQDYPDIQQHYQGMLLREQLQRQEESSIIEQLRYQEELRRHQMQDAYGGQHTHAQELAQAHAQDFAEARARAQAQEFAEAQARAHAEAQAQEMAHSKADSQSQPSDSSDVARLRDLAADSLAGNAVKKSEVDRKRSDPYASDRDASVETEEPPMKKPAKEKVKPAKAKSSPKVKKKSEGLSPKKAAGPDTAQSKGRPSPKGAKKTKKLEGKKTKKSPKSVAKVAAQHQHSVGGPRMPDWDDRPASHISPQAPPFYYKGFSPLVSSAAPPMDQLGMSPGAVPRVGTLQGLLDAAEEDDDVENAVGALHAFSGVKSSDLEGGILREPQISKKKKVSIHLSNGFKSSLPQLPEEPLWVETPARKAKSSDSYVTSLEATEHGSSEQNGQGAMEIDPVKPKTRTVSNVLDYPYPIDVWWPSVQSIRRERREAGYASDEDDFKEEPSVENEEQHKLRANLPAIKTRLSQDLRPGVLEKLPHCKLHRVLMKKKKNLSAPELVYCWQVTDIYPNHLMVCCSVCGTWRHAQCGGHHKPYSVRENTEEPFAAVCDFCHEEQQILCDYPIAQERIEKQRMEQLRRGLTTSAVMRHASFSKHGGTYKWPLGRVSPTQIGGHTRSVHTRHDKAEKQWADMATRLARGYGYRPRERARVRTKELERLLVSVEDAESYTDRHNILLFLMRDTTKEHPVGFENERTNIFDPEEDEVVMQYLPEGKSDSSVDHPQEDYSESNGKQLPVDSQKDESTGKAVENGGENIEPVDDKAQQLKKNQPSLCVRSGCSNKPRFDSMFCSDSCGVSALESDLLCSLQESSDIHPSVLRN